MLRVENLSKAFGSNRALHGLTFHVDSGEVYGLLGPNGAGKSTTFSIICNLLKDDAGSVQLDGWSCGMYSACSMEHPLIPFLDARSS